MEQGILPLGPQTFKEPNEAFVHDFYHYELRLHAVSLSFTLSGLNSELLGKMLSQLV